MDTTKAEKVRDEAVWLKDFIETSDLFDTMPKGDRVMLQEICSSIDKYATLLEGETL